MCKIIPAEKDKPFFLVREGKICHPLTASQINRLLKEYCKRARVQGNYTAHCLRKGGLNWAHRAQLTGESLQALGGWASDAYKRYLNHDFEARIQAGKHMAELKL